MRQVDLERLYRRLEKPLYNVVYRWVWNPEDAREIVQEAFVRLWRMRRRVEMKTVEPLVYRIALNLASTRRRAGKLWRWISLEAVRERTDPRHEPDAELSRSRVRKAVHSLPEDLRRIVILCEFSDLSYAEIAGILSIPEGTVGSRRNRALKLLRARLSGEVEP
jgi:RNA polymerase sigma-70 factor (ECF subfamily)